MTTTIRCQCGHGANVRDDGGEWCVACRLGCGAEGPRAPTEAAAIAAWEELMRPRPVAKWDESNNGAALWVGFLCLGRVVLVEGCGWDVLCTVTGERPYHAPLPHEDSARAWLVVRVRSLGFEVSFYREEETQG